MITRKHPWLTVAVGLLIVGLVALLYGYRWALLPDRVIADQVRRSTLNAKGLEEVRSKLEERYRVLASGRGHGPEIRQGEAERGENYVHIVVGHYRVIFRTSVEAFVVVDAEGRVVDVEVRRTTDSP